MPAIPANIALLKRYQYAIYVVSGKSSEGRPRWAGQPAGVRIIESRLTRLSLAPEIAQAMLRQQQASRGRRADADLEGAVGMVQLALQQLGGGSLYQ